MIAGTTGISVGFQWQRLAHSGPSPLPSSKQPNVVHCAVAQPNQHVNNTLSMESTEQNKALMKLLQAFQMPVHISVLLGSTQSEIRLSGSQPGNGLCYSSFPSLVEESQDTGLPRRMCSWLPREWGSLVSFLCNFLGKRERKDKPCFMLCIESVNA